MTKIGVTVPSRSGPLSAVPGRACAAEAAGFDSLWVYELYRDPFSMLGACATATETAALGTGIAAAFSRSPFELANAALDVDELSSGRMMLGLGTGAPEILHGFHSADATRPVARMTEYLRALRLSWQYLLTGEAEPFDGNYYRFIPPPMNVFGLRTAPRDHIPVALAAMRPKMLELVGRTADGWLGYLASRRFVEQRVIPSIEQGARKAGRDPSSVELAAEIICSVSPDPAVALRRARIQVGTYLAHPVSDPVVAIEGLEVQQQALRVALMTNGPAALETTDERLVDAFSITGTPQDAAQQLSAYDHLDHIILHAPYVPPLEAEDTDDAYRNILATFGHDNHVTRSSTTPPHPHLPS